jgi:hypothetical protein
LCLSCFLITPHLVIKPVESMTDEESTEINMEMMGKHLAVNQMYLCVKKKSLTDCGYCQTEKVPRNKTSTSPHAHSGKYLVVPVHGIERRIVREEQHTEEQPLIMMEEEQPRIMTEQELQEEQQEERHELEEERLEEEEEEQVPTPPASVTTSTGTATVVVSTPASAVGAAAEGAAVVSIATVPVSTPPVDANLAASPSLVNVKKRRTISVIQKVIQCATVVVAWNTAQCLILPCERLLPRKSPRHHQSLQHHLVPHQGRKVLTPAGAIIVILLDLKTMATGVITLTLRRGICVRPSSSPKTVAFAKRDSASRNALSVQLKSGL